MGSYPGSSPAFNNSVATFPSWVRSFVRLTFNIIIISAKLKELCSSDMAEPMWVTGVHGDLRWEKYCFDIFQVNQIVCFVFTGSILVFLPMPSFGCCLQMPCRFYESEALCWHIPCVSVEGYQIISLLSITLSRVSQTFRAQRAVCHIATRGFVFVVRRVWSSAYVTIFIPLGAMGWLGINKSSVRTPPCRTPCLNNRRAISWKSTEG